MDKSSKIYVAGHNGMVGSAIVRRLKKEGYKILVLKGSNELDLRDQRAVGQFFSVEAPDFVFLVAAKVGGIMANMTSKADFIYDNLMIQSNVIHAAYKSGVKKLLFLGSSCIYPKHSKIPIAEDQLMTGPIEPTNDAYAIAKIAGITMIQAYRQQYGCNFISAMPCNLYGPNDNYDSETSHVLAALIRKIHEAKQKELDEITIWGTGKPRREFMHVDDLADACLFLMHNHEGGEIINVGSGTDISIEELAQKIKEIIGFNGAFSHDLSKPDGTFQKTLDNTKIKAMGWQATIPLSDGIRQAYAMFCQKEEFTK